MLWAARKVGRPVKWIQTRNEAHISDDDARDNIVDAALALDKDGKFLGVRIRSFGNLGAFVSFRGAMPPVVNIGTVVGTYLTPALHVAVSGMLTNTHCTSPYRGAGRPEASYMIERLIDIAADAMKIDPAELRRRNTIPPQAMPYKTPLVFTYDSGHFEENLDRTMKLADWRGFEARRKEAARRGMLRGIGISNTIEQAADPTIETAEIRFDPLGGLTLVTGSISHGQGHATIQTQILVDRLGIDPQRVKFIQGDTDAVAFGMGTGGSRSTTMSGGAIAMVSEKIVAKGTKLAAHLMEAAEGDVDSRTAASLSRTDRCRGTEHHRNLATGEVSRRGCGAFVWHVNDVEAGRALEQLAGQMQRRSDPRRAIGQLAGIGLGIGDQFGNGFHRQIVAHRQHIKTRDRGDDAVEILDRIERQRAIKPGHVGHAAVVEQERVAVRLRFRDFVHADAAAGAAAVIDHDGLTEALAERI